MANTTHKPYGILEVMRTSQPPLSLGKQGAGLFVTLQNPGFDFPFYFFCNRDYEGQVMLRCPQKKSSSSKSQMSFLNFIQYILKT